MNQRVLTYFVMGALALITGELAQAQSAYSNAVAALGPVAYWPLNETTAPAGGLYVATNSGTLGAAGNGYYETWWQTNGVSNALVSSNSIVHIAGAIAGDSDTALQQGAVGQYVVIPRVTNGVADTAVTLTAPFTIEMWVYPTNSTASQLKPILAEGFNNVQNTNLGYATLTEGVAIGQYSSFIYFNTYNGAGTKSEIDTATLALNKWYHIVATFDGTTKRFYTNGVLVTTQVPAAANGVNYAPDLVSPLIVGGGNELGISGGANVPFGGGIDEVAIYNTVLTQTQVTNHYAYGTNSARLTPYAQVVSGDSPKIYLRLDEPAFTGAGAPNTYPTANNYGSLAAAANGNYLPGATPGVAGPAYSGFGSPSYAVALNGFNAGVDIGGGSLPAALNPTASQPLTVAAWFKGNPADCVGRFQTIVGHSDSNWRLNLDLNAGAQFNPGNGPLLQFTGVADELADGMFVNDGNWHLVAGVSDGTNDFLYVDGLPAKSGTAVGTNSGSLFDVILGGDPQYLAPQPTTGASGGGHWFDGSLAQVAFFTNALTGSQIQGLYSAAGVPPALRVPPQSQVSLDAGSAASVPAAIFGSTPMSVQWYQNSLPVSGQTNSSLTFNPVTTGSAGTYYLIVTNNFGSVTSSVVQVTVFQPNTYAYTVRQFNPAAYWPLNETAMPPNGQYIATNSGTAGAAGNGYYQSWYQPVTITNANGVVMNTFYATNRIQHTAGATGDGDSSLVCGNALGAGQYVVIPRTTNGVVNAALNFTAPFSVEAWVKTTNITTSTIRPIVTEGRNQTQGNASHSYTNSEYGFSLGQYQGFFYFQLYNGNTLGNSGALIPEIDANGIASNVWYHVVATYDGNTESIYTNGILAASAVMTTYVPDPTSPLLIGTGTELSAANGGSEFTGGIDDVAIYNAVLTQSQIQTHYAAVGPGYAATVLADSPSIYLRLDEPAFNSYPSPGTYPVATNYGFTGAAGNGVYQPGTAPGAAGPPYAGFGSNAAVAINGFYGAVDVGGGTTPVQLNPTGLQPQTVTAWFQANPADARFQEIVSRGDASWRLALNGYNGSPSSAPYDIHFNPGANSADIGCTNINDVLANHAFVNDGNWHFATGVSDGTNAYLYIDGALAKKTNVVSSLAGAALDTLIGGSPAHTTPNYNTASALRYFDGQIAQVAYFTNALNAAQIQQIYGVAGVPLTLLTQPQAVTNNSGSSASLTVVVGGSAPAYQWYSTNVNTGAVAPVAGQTSANLVFNPVNLNNAGYYFVIATNSNSSVTSSVAQLTVVGPPILLAQSPTNIEVFAGTAPVLQTTVFGPPPLAYQWTSNSVPIPGATAAGFAPNTAVTGANVYGCTITNIYGSVTNAPITVAVLADPTAPYPVKVLADSPVAYYRLDETGGTTAYDYAGGNNATYTNVTLGLAGYSSTQDSGELAAEFGDYPPNNNYAGNVPAYLNFGTTNGGNAEFSVEAWITQYFYENGGDCVVALGYGNGGEQFDLDTGNGSGGALRFLVRNAAGTGYSASSTNFLENDGLWHHIVGVCDEAGGHVYIYLDGQQAGSAAIPAGGGLLASTTPLSIGARQSGNYNGTNYDFQFIGKIDDVAVYNQALNSAQVQAHYLQSGVAPSITQVQPSSLTTNQAGNAAFTVSAFGTAPLTYQWTDNNNNPIAWGTNATLTLTNVQTSQSGTYTVYVSNLYGGPASTNVNLTVTEIPQIVTDVTPSNLVVFATEPSVLSVTASGTPPLSYQWYQNGAPIVGATNTTYSFDALAGTNTYYLAVTNGFSAGSPTLSSTATVVGMPSTSLTPGNYTDNLKITFAGYNRNETLSDFPVLVRLSTSLPGFNYSHFADPMGGDLRFTDSGGTRVIPSEIDQWNTNGESTVWVQVPALSGTNGVIRAYWGNPAATTPPPGTNVWVPQPWESLPPFDVVYHLEESGFPYADAAGQFPSIDGIAPTPVAGVVGTGESFASSPYLDAGPINVGNYFTLSAWVNVAASASSIQTVWASKGGSSSNGFALFVNAYLTTDQELIFETANGSAAPTLASPAGAVSSNQWHLVTAVVNRPGGTGQLYVDGVATGVTGSVRTDFATNEEVYLAQFPGPAFQFDGLMDEARIQAGTNSANWVWASYMTVAQNTNFQNYSAVTTTVVTPPTPVTIQVQFTGGNLTLSGTGGSSDATYYVIGSTNLALPVASWTVLATNVFDGSGNFNASVPVDTTKQTLFLRIKE